MYKEPNTETSLRRRDRDRYLTELYCEIYDTISWDGITDKRKVAVSMALKLGSPQYNVGFDRAYIVVAKMLRDKSSISFNSLVIRDMWYEITSKTKSLMDLCHLSIAKSLDIVLTYCRASRFFLSEHHAWVVIKRELQKMNIRRPYGRKVK